MSKLPEGFSREVVAEDTMPSDFTPIITLGMDEKGRFAIILNNKFGDACVEHNQRALEILAVAPKLVADMAEQLLRKQ